MTGTWKRIEYWLKGHAPILLSNLREPATSAEINDLEKTLSIKLPKSYIDFLKIHNGQIESGYGLIDLEILNSTEYISSHWSMWDELLRQDEFKTYKSTPDAGIKDDWWNTKWIPITSDGAGNHICIDLDPAQGGKRGQIISMIHDSPERELLANSFEEFIKEYVSDLEKGKCAYYEEYKGVSRKSLIKED